MNGESVYTAPPPCQDPVSLHWEKQGGPTLRRARHAKLHSQIGKYNFIVQATYTLELKYTWI